MAGTHWFHDKMTHPQRKAYLRAHPNSKMHAGRSQRAANNSFAAHVMPKPMPAKRAKALLATTIGGKAPKPARKKPVLSATTQARDTAKRMSESPKPMKPRTAQRSKIDTPVLNGKPIGKRSNKEPATVRADRTAKRGTGQVKTTEFNRSARSAQRVGR